MIVPRMISLLLNIDVKDFLKFPTDIITMKMAKWNASIGSIRPSLILTCGRVKNIAKNIMAPWIAASIKFMYVLNSKAL